MSHDPYAHNRSDSVDGIGKPFASGNNGGCVEVSNFACGCCHVYDSKHPDEAPKAYNAVERLAVLADIAVGKNPRFHLGDAVRAALLEALAKDDLTIFWTAVEAEKERLALTAC